MFLENSLRISILRNIGKETKNAYFCEFHTFSCLFRQSHQWNCNQNLFMDILGFFRISCFEAWRYLGPRLRNLGWFFKVSSFNYFFYTNSWMKNKKNKLVLNIFKNIYFHTLQKFWLHFSSIMVQTGRNFTIFPYNWLFIKF